MGDYTPRLGMYRPAREDQINVQDDVNQAKGVLDAAVDRVCTSFSRPAAVYVGMRCYETDTGAIVVCSNVQPVTWQYLTTPTTNSLAERDALTPTEGMSVFRQDKGWYEDYVAGAWRPRTVPLVANLGDISDPAVGQMVIYTYDMTIRRWTSDGRWAIVTPTGAISRSARFVQKSGMVTNGDTAVTFPIVRREAPLFVRPDTAYRTFELRASGDWVISASWRGTMGLEVGIYTGTMGNYMSHSQGNPTSSVTISQYFAAGTVIGVQVWTPSASESTTGFGDTNNVSFIYLGGEN